MRVTWSGIYDRGNLALERVHFRATNDLDLQFFILLDTVIVKPNVFQALSPVPYVQTGNRNCCWFPPFKVKAGENIVVYSRDGTHNTEKHTDGMTYHFFFRAFSSPIYSTPDKCALLFESSAWQINP